MAIYIVYNLIAFKGMLLFAFTKKVAMTKLLDFGMHQPYKAHCAMQNLHIIGADAEDSRQVDYPPQI